MLTSTTRAGRIAVGAAVLALAVVPAAIAGKGGKGGVIPTSSSTKSGCTQNAPRITVQNTYGWGQSGSWGLPGQQLGYQIQVADLDAGCGSASFVMSVSAPAGFPVSVPTNTVSLKPGTSAYLWAYVTSPSGAVDGDYPLTVAVARSTTGAAPEASSTTYFKVYSSDTTAPTLFWPNPSDGATLSGTSYNVVVYSNDDHAMQKIELYIDGAYRTAFACEDIAYNCALSYKWSLRRVHGQHTATFKSYDWMGNVAAMTVTFSVS
jgi:hypothetical protein